MVPFVDARHPLRLRAKSTTVGLAASQLAPRRTSRTLISFSHKKFFTMSRPELQTPPELFYNDKMSRKYNSNSRMVGIQAEISNRCIELLNIPVRTGATDTSV